MDTLENTKKKPVIWGSRFAITLVFSIIIGVIACWAIAKDKDEIVMSCISALTIVIPVYIAGDTVRRSGTDLINRIQKNDSQQATS